MTKLTEEMVIARSRQSDLASIKKLNCWGSDLSDVSIIRRMRGVEVLALSVNKISSLQDFEDCRNLQELYLRKNNIQDINEIAYLQSLPNLKYLWLEENPCCEQLGPNYRSIVLRALPNLKKLDNVEVTPEEVQDAMRMPVKRDEEYYEEDNERTNNNTVNQQQQQYQQEQQQQQQQRHQQLQQQQQYQQQTQSQQRRSQSPKKENSQNIKTENSEESISDTMNQPSVPSSPLQRTSPPNQDYAQQEQGHPPSPKYNKDHRTSYHQYDRSPGSDQESPSAGGGGYRERGPIPPSVSTHSMKEYYQSDYQKPSHPPAHYRYSQSDLTEWDEHQNQFNGSSYHSHQRRSAGTEREISDRYAYRNGNVRERDEWEDTERIRRERRTDGRFSDTASVVSNALLNHCVGHHRRPINRCSNLLSATLCLIKELDYTSLEVLEHAIRLRIDELTTE